jgi:hypothetical protein
MVFKPVLVNAASMTGMQQKSNAGGPDMHSAMTF